VFKRLVHRIQLLHLQLVLRGLQRRLLLVDEIIAERKEEIIELSLDYDAIKKKAFKVKMGIISIERHKP
jgi:hypothetical protein